MELQGGTKDRGKRTLASMTTFCLQNSEEQNKRERTTSQKMKIFTKMIKNEKHFTSVLHGFSEAFVTGKFCDVKVVCKVRVAKLSEVCYET